MEFFSPNMKYLRHKSGFTQIDIQEKLGIEPTTWSNYERGVSFPKLHLFHQISKYFGVPENILLNEDLANSVNPQKKIKANVQEEEKEQSDEKKLLGEIINLQKKTIAMLEEKIENLTRELETKAKTME